jgi:hypothetical protein
MRGLVPRVGRGVEEPAEDQQHVDAANPGAQRTPLVRLLGQRNVADLLHFHAGCVDGRLHAAQCQHLGRGLELTWVAAVERCGAQDHAALRPEVRQVAGDQRDQERRSRHGPVDPGDVSSLRPELLGDHRPRDVWALVTNAVRPLERWVAEIPGAVQREPLGDVLGVAVGDPPERSPPRERAPDAALTSSATGGGQLL